MNNTTAADWLRRNKKDVSEFGARVAALVWELYGSLYHIQSAANKTDWAAKNEVVVVTVRDSDLSTYDSDYLTRLVILAHKHNSRASIKGAAPGYIRLVFCEVTRHGFFCDNHPTLAELKERISQTHIDKIEQIAA